MAADTAAARMELVASMLGQAALQTIGERTSQVAVGKKSFMENA